MYLMRYRGATTKRRRKMDKKETIADQIQQVFDKRRAQLSDEEREKNSENWNNFRQAVSDVWNNRVPTPWAVNAMEHSGQHDELVKAIADRWQQAFAELTKEEI
jgi:hypothetical protein